MNDNDLLDKINKAKEISEINSEIEKTRHLISSGNLLELQIICKNYKANIGLKRQNII